jgi:hypothetical protein
VDQEAQLGSIDIQKVDNKMRESPHPSKAPTLPRICNCPFSLQTAYIRSNQVDTSKICRPNFKGISCILLIQIENWYSPRQPLLGLFCISADFASQLILLFSAYFALLSLSCSSQLILLFGLFIFGRHGLPQYRNLMPAIPSLTSRDVDHLRCVHNIEADIWK